MRSFLRRSVLAFASVVALVGGLGSAGSAQSTDPIRIGIEAPWDLPYVPLSLAIDKLKPEGLSFEPVLFAEPDAMALALANGDIDIASSDAGTILAAIEGGLKIKAFMGLTIPDFVLIADADASTCETLAGKRLGVHSQRDIFGTAISRWVEAQCPGTEFQRIVLPGSENRIAALTNDQLEATPVHVLPALQLQKVRPGEFKIVEGFGFPKGVVNSWYYAESEWLEENRETVAKLVNAVQEVIEEAGADPTALVDRSKELIPDVDPEIMDNTVRRLLEMGFWNPKTGLQKDAFDATVAFFSETVDFAQPAIYEGTVFQVE